jgi:hypothetical protein
MPVSNEELFSIKSKQYVLIARAGLSLPSHEMDSKSIHAKMFIQFKHHVERVKLPQGFAKNTFFRTSRHLDEAVTDKEIHNGGHHFGGNFAPSRSISTTKLPPSTCRY